tara:strand:- start:961 stop:1269 length:309 start_codon:yes stop_codon:yes gene_type:complete
MKAIIKNVSKTLERELSMAKENMQLSLEKIIDLRLSVFPTLSVKGELAQRMVVCDDTLTKNNRIPHSLKNDVRRLHEEIELYETSRRKYEEYKEIKTELENY